MQSKNPKFSAEKLEQRVQKAIDSFSKIRIPELSPDDYSNRVKISYT